LALNTNTIENLQADFELLDDWEERYRYVIELGRLLPPFEEKFRTPKYKVSGCASQVWIHSEQNGPALTFSGDSDAIIVKGLIAIAFMIFSGKTPEQILALDANAIFTKLGLKEHLTPQRSNGLVSMVARIKSDAHQVLAA
jgi:cysteine desulfuration protein SufE